MYYRGSLDRIADRDLAAATRESEPLMSGMPYSTVDFQTKDTDNAAHFTTRSVPSHGVSTAFAPTSLMPLDTSLEGLGGAGSGSGPHHDVSFPQPSTSPTVESAEEILQAVEAQLEQSPLLSRRSSISMSLMTRQARSSRSPTSPGLSLSAVAAAAAAAIGAAAATGGAAALTAGGSIAGSSTSRGSSFGGAPPPQGSLSWLQQQNPSQQHPSGPPHTEGYFTQHQQQLRHGRHKHQQQDEPAVAATIAPTDIGGASIGQLVTSASFSAGLLGEACDAATAVDSNGSGATAALGIRTLAAVAPAATAASTAAANGSVNERSKSTFTSVEEFGIAMAPTAAAVSVARAAGGAAGPTTGPQSGGYVSVSVVPSRPLAAGGGGGGSGGDGTTPRLQMAAGIGGSSNFLPGSGGGGIFGGGSVVEKKVAIAGVRTWLKVRPDGSATIVQLDRAQLGLQYGVQLRDFRVLDPVLGATYPACLLCREGALIVNLDPIKVIITAHFALVNHAESDKARPFIDELKRRLHNYLSSKINNNAVPTSTHVLPTATAVTAAAAAAVTEGIPFPRPTSQIDLHQHQHQHQTLKDKDSPRTAAAVADGAGGGAVAASAAAQSGGETHGAVIGSRAASVTSLLGLTAPQQPSHPEGSQGGRIAHVAQALLSLLPQNVRLGSGAAAAALDSIQLLLPRPHGLKLVPLALGGALTNGGGGGGEGHQVSEMVASMPFELRALEVVLEQTVSLLDAQTTELERATRIALDELTLRVNPRNLERMRHLKGRMASLTNKVDTVRGVLEKLLDDDRAMAAMNLTAKDEQQQQQQQQAVAAAVAAREQEREQQLSSGSAIHQSTTLRQLPAGGPTGNTSTLEHTPSQCVQLGGAPGGVPAHQETMNPDSEEVAVVEMLLEAYFMQLGHTWQRLQSLKSYIDSTEDLINLELDQQRNNLISVDLMVTFGSFLLTAMSVIAGLFGMNVTNRMEGDYSAFLGICIGSASTAVALWLLFVYCSIRYGLMNGLSMTWR